MGLWGISEPSGTLLSRIRKRINCCEGAGIFLRAKGKNEERGGWVSTNQSLKSGEATPMSKPLIDDRLWKLIEPILPAPKPRNFRYPGRLPLPNRAVLN